MKNKYLCCNGDNGKYEMLWPLKTKSEAKADEKADQVINDLLSALSFTINEYEDSHTAAPEFIKSLVDIKKQLWRML